MLPWTAALVLLRQEVDLTFPVLGKVVWTDTWGAHVPDWYRIALAELFLQIEGPIAALFPDLDRRALDLMVRGLFSAVHGIVLLGLNNRSPAAPLAEIETMIAMVLREIGR